MAPEQSEPRVSDSAAAIDSALQAVRYFPRSHWLDVVRRDQFDRWRRGCGVVAETYLRLLPELADDPEDTLVFICGEVHARHATGEAVELDEYQRRFPKLAAELAVQFELDRSLGYPSAESDEPDDRGPEFGLPGYHMLREIGRGAAGVVYLARQVSIDRLVAIKAIHAENSDPAHLPRHRQEAAILSRMQHPNVVQIYDVIEADGLLCSVIEFVDGPTLAESVAGKPLPPVEAARLTSVLAAAVHAVHEAGILHRDLKPSNVLLTPRGEPKLTDFGLAKVLDGASLLTTHHGLLGTPSYMPPEQIDGSGHGTGREGDIYSLGAILYELLTGRPPFMGVTVLDTLSMILGREPIPPRSSQPSTPRDLETICLTCLAKSPHKRYRTAAALAADLQRFLAGAPIQARPPSWGERALRWCRRNSTLATALGAVMTLLLAIAAVSLWYSGRLRDQLAKTQQAEKAEQAASQSARVRLWDAYLAEISARNTSRHVGQRFAALETVDKARNLIDVVGRTPERVQRLRNAALASLALPDLRLLRVVSPLPPDSLVVGLSLTSQHYLVRTPQGLMSLHDLANGRQIARFEAPGPVTASMMSADGTLVAGRWEGGSRVWRVEEGRLPVVAWERAGATQFAFIPDNRQAALSVDGQGMFLVDAATGQTLRRLGRGTAQSFFSFNLAQRRIAVVADGRVQIIAWDQGDVVSELPGIHTEVCSLAWHPSGDYLAIWDGFKEIALWNTHKGEKVLSYPHTGYPGPLHFCAEGTRLLSYSLWDSRLLMWDFGTGQKLLEERAFSFFMLAEPSAEAIYLLRPVGNQAELWEVATGRECLALPHKLHPSLNKSHRLSIRGDNRLLLASYWGGLRVWDLDTQQLLAEWRGGPAGATFDRDGNLLIACQQGVFRWPKSESRTASLHTVKFGPPQALFGPVSPASLVASTGGERLAFIASDGWRSLQVSSAPQSVLLPTTEFDPREAAVSSDGRLVAIANWNSPGAAVWDAATGQQVHKLAVGPTGSVLFSPNGRWLATTPDGVQLWRVGNWRLDREMKALGTKASGLAMAFSPDSRVLAIGQSTGDVRLADPDTGDDWAQLTHPELSSFVALAFSPDQTRLVTLPTDEQSAALVWDLAALRRQLSKRGLDWPADVLGPTPNARAAAVPLQVILDDGDLFHQIKAPDNTELPN